MSPYVFIAMDFEKKNIEQIISTRFKKKIIWLSKFLLQTF